MTEKSPLDAEPEARDRVKMTVEMSASLNRVVESIAASFGTSKSDVIRKALALLEVAAEAKANDQMLGIVNKRDGKLVTRIIGL